MLLEAVLQLTSIWVEPEKIVAKFDEDKKYIRILALGDSNTYGLFLEPHQAWPKQLEKIWNNTQSQKISVLNLGYPGTNTIRVAEEIDAIMDAAKPDLVVMMLGGNDFWTASLPEKEKKEKKLDIKKYLLKIRTYKIIDFLLKENIYKDDPRYNTNKIYEDLSVLPKKEGIEELKKFLIHKNLNLI